MIKVQKFIVGEIFTNCYLVEDTDSGKLLVVDPGAMSFELIDEIEGRGGKLEYVLLTHGHFDHMTFAQQLKDKFNCQICVGALEKEVINDPSLNLSSNHNLKLDTIEVDKYLEDGDVISFGNVDIKYLSTPGHTKGSGIYIMDNIIFSGDTLFYESIGRTDFPTSSMDDMISSLKKIAQIDGDYKVLTGHDISTKLSHEKKRNPYFRF